MIQSTTCVTNFVECFKFFNHPSEPLMSSAVNLFMERRVPVSELQGKNIASHYPTFNRLCSLKSWLQTLALSGNLFDEELIHERVHFTNEEKTF